MTRTPLGALALVACGALLLTACSGGASGAGTTTAPGASATAAAPAEKVSITYSDFISNGGNEANLATIVTAFEAANPDITVDVKTMPYADYFTALQTDVAGGTAADVFDIEYATYASLSKAGVLAELPGVDAAAYKPSLVQAYQTDGKQYALPSSFSTVVLFYNKALFDAKGVAYPTASWTWADEQAAAAKLTDTAAGVWGDYQPISYNEFYKAVTQAGGKFLSDDGTKAAFNTPAGRRRSPVADRQERHRHADRRPGRRHPGLRLQAVPRRQAGDVAHRHLDVRRRGRRAVRLGRRGRAR